MGAHIEMTRTRGRDYSIGTTYQPEEPPLQMTLDQMRALRGAATRVADLRGAHTFDDFVIFNGSGRAAVAHQMMSSMWARLRRTT